jgi:flagellar P-ring protein precursor FlgI
LFKFFLLILVFITSYGQTIKDISNIVGIRENQLIGYGLVVGLPGTGDKSQFTMQSLQNLLRNSYIKLPEGTQASSKNIATVMVTASLPPFARQGDKIKLTISSIGDAKSIDGGQLLLTQLKGVDGRVYALAQGKITADTQTPTSGYIYEGAIVENEIDFSLKDENYITLSLLKHDAKTAALCEEKINKKFGKKLAVAYDTRTIEVAKPDDMSIIRFLSELQNIKLDTDMKKKIVIDMNKEMIIAGADIIVEPVTISRKDFTLRIKKTTLSDKQWADPAVNTGANAGDDVSVDTKNIDPNINTVNFNNTLIDTKKPPTISDLMRIMKTMNVSINEIIETIKLLDSLGAVNADVEIIN